jgi:hypothetical protein
MNRNPDAGNATDFNQYYEEYCREVKQVSRETYNRYCRYAFSALHGDAKDSVKVRTTDDGMFVEMTSADIKTEDDLVAYGNIDLDKWNAVELTNERWGNADNPNYLIKAKYKAIVEPSMTPEKMLQLYEEVLEQSTKIKPQKAHNVSNGFTQLLSLPDMHVGKIIYGEATGNSGEDYDSNIASTLYSTAVDNLSRGIDKKATKQIVFPFGEDFFNVDNLSLTTTKGTHQTNGDPYEMLSTGLASVFNSIDTLAEISNVHVPIVPGNHDRLVTYLIGLALQQRYRNDARVSIDAEPRQEKLIHDGKFCFMLIHGGRLKTQALAWRLANNYPKVWAETIFREVFSGHYHHNAVKDESGVRVNYLPSLKPTDLYEVGMNYQSMREAHLYTYSPNHGRISVQYYSPYWGI